LPDAKCHNEVFTVGLLNHKANNLSAKEMDEMIKSYTQTKNDRGCAVYFVLKRELQQKVEK
jgi:hypothetical protein